MEDWDAWLIYTQHRWAYNKLDLSLKLGHLCGPTPLPVPKSGEYCVRPVINLGGMSAGATIQYLERGKVHDLPPGYFWCERFVGDQYSVDFEWKGHAFVPVHTSIGKNSPESLYRFEKWVKVPNKHFDLPEWVSEFSDVEKINIEFIGDKIVEIHLRWGEDFPTEDTTEVIPIWDDTPQDFCHDLETQGYSFIEDYIDAEKNIPHARLGFYYR